MGEVYLDRDGQEKPVVMGCYRIGSGRLLSCILEEHHDDRGIRFPISVAPYHVYCVAMGQRGRGRCHRRAALPRRLAARRGNAPGRP